MTTNQLITKIGRQRVLTALSNVVCASNSSGSGDVTGPASSTNEGIAVYDGLTGKIIKDLGLSPAALQTIRRNAGNTAWEVFTPGGSGDVVGPASAVDSSLAEFDGTTGKLVKDGGVVVSAFAKTVLDDTTAAAARTTLGTESRTLWINNSSSGLTGTTVETKVASFEIDPSVNPIGPNDIMEVIPFSGKSGVNGTFVIRAYLNTSDAIGGEQFIQYTTPAASRLSLGIARRGLCKNSTNSQRWAQMTSAMTDDIIDANAAMITTAADMTAIQWLVISYQLNGAGSDTVTLEGVMFNIYRQS